MATLRDEMAQHFKTLESAQGGIMTEGPPLPPKFGESSPLVTSAINKLIQRIQADPSTVLSELEGDKWPTIMGNARRTLLQYARDLVGYEKGQSLSPTLTPPKGGDSRDGKDYGGRDYSSWQGWSSRRSRFYIGPW